MEKAKETKEKTQEELISQLEEIGQEEIIAYLVNTGVKWKNMRRLLNRDKTMEARLKTLGKFYWDDKWPISVQVFGYPQLIIRNKDDCAGRMKEVSEQCGMELQVNAEVNTEAEQQITEPEPEPKGKG